MTNYTLQLSPSTYSAAAGALALAAVMAAQARVEAMDSIDAALKPSTVVVGSYREVGFSPTIGLNLGEVSVLNSYRYLGEASQAFVAQLSSGMQPLGTEFAEILEENFWDLVLG